jgi:hypothetical protein
MVSKIFGFGGSRNSCGSKIWTHCIVDELSFKGFLFNFTIIESSLKQHLMQSEMKKNSNNLPDLIKKGF